MTDDAAALIERLDRWMPADRYSATELMNESAAVLRAQAQENERVTNELATLVAEFNARGMERDGLRAKCATLEERIRELEGGYLATLSRCDQLISAAEEQRDAIRVKTIEECAQVIQEDFDRPDMAEAIRALAHASTPFDKGSGAQQDESKTESGE